MRNPFEDLSHHITELKTTLHPGSKLWKLLDSYSIPSGNNDNDIKSLANLHTILDTNTNEVKDRILLEKINLTILRGIEHCIIESFKGHINIKKQSEEKEKNDTSFGIWLLFALICFFLYTLAMITGGILALTITGFIQLFGVTVSSVVTYSLIGVFGAFAAGIFTLFELRAIGKRLNISILEAQSYLKLQEEQAKQYLKTLATMQLILSEDKTFRKAELDYLTNAYTQLNTLHQGFNRNIAKDKNEQSNLSCKTLFRKTISIIGMGAAGTIGFAGSFQFLFGLLFAGSVVAAGPVGIAVCVLVAAICGIAAAGIYYSVTETDTIGDLLDSTLDTPKESSLEKLNKRNEDIKSGMENVRKSIRNQQKLRNSNLKLQRYQQLLKSQEHSDNGTSISRQPATVDRTPGDNTTPSVAHNPHRFRQSISSNPPDSAPLEFSSTMQRKY